MHSLIFVSNILVGNAEIYHMTYSKLKEKLSKVYFGGHKLQDTEKGRIFGLEVSVDKYFRAISANTCPHQNDLEKVYNRIKMLP